MEFREFILFDEIASVLNEFDLYWLFSENAPLSPKNAQQLKNNLHINPKTGMSYRPVDAWEQVKAIVAHEVKVNKTDVNKIWLTFSEVSKLGQRAHISDSKSTPVGIFAFPIKYALKKTTNLPFGSRPYIHIFKTNKSHFEAGGYADDQKKQFSNIKDKLNLANVGNDGDDDNVELRRFMYSQFDDATEDALEKFERHADENENVFGAKYNYGGWREKVGTWIKRKKREIRGEISYIYTKDRMKDFLRDLIESFTEEDLFEEKGRKMDKATN